MRGADVGLTAGIWLWVALTATVCCVLFCLLGWRQARRVRRRTGGLLPVSPGGAGDGGRFAVSGRGGAGARSGHAVRHVAARWQSALAALGALGAGFAMVGGVAGVLTGVAGACGAWRLLGHRRSRVREAEGTAEVRAAAAQLPLTAELLAACLAAGSGPGQAAEAVGRSLGGPLGLRLVRAATELRLGGEPAVVWQRFEMLPSGGPFARCMERAGTAGVPAVEPVTRLAAELRADRGRAASVRARRVAVLVTGPLGLCFLPAFLAVGVAPVVLGLAASLG